jgi:hypothetical protein
MLSALRIHRDRGGLPIEIELPRIAITGSASRRDLEGEITFAQLIPLTALAADPLTDHNPASRPCPGGPDTGSHRYRCAHPGYREDRAALGQAIIGNRRTWRSAAGTL